MNADRVAADLEGGTYAIAGFLTGALQLSIANARVARARAYAEDAQAASAIRQASAAAHAHVSRETARQLADKQAHFDILQERYDLLEFECADLRATKSTLLAHCASLLAEVDQLRVRR
jgi:hypothetical protein